MHDFYLRAYKKELETRVRSFDNNLLETEYTLFFPGGGGQSCDIGTIESPKFKGQILETLEEGSTIFHKVKGKGTLKKGDRVKLILDWDRRYQLMQGHTAEHLLYGRIQELLGTEIQKVKISPEKFAVFIEAKTLPWPKLLEAEKQANDSISRGDEVTAKLYGPEAAGKLNKLRVKWDKVSGKIRVVQIGDFDFSACKGIHVANTKELELLAIKSVNHVQGIYEIEFVVGEEARKLTSERSMRTLELSELLATDEAKLVSTVSNLKKSESDLKERLRAFSKDTLKVIPHEELRGVKVYSTTFDGLNKKDLIDRIGKLLAEPKTIVAIGNKEDKAFLALGRSPDLDFDILPILKEACKKVGGTGGGRTNYGMGGGPALDKTEDAVAYMLKTIKSRL